MADFRSNSGWYQRYWIGKFQEGMRNADGSPRRPKYEINVEAIPDNVRIL